MSDLISDNRLLQQSEALQAQLSEEVIDFAGFGREGCYDHMGLSGCQDLPISVLLSLVFGGGRS
eukprot:6417009-Amphidinium_carterae.1